MAVINFINTIVMSWVALKRHLVMHSCGLCSNEDKWERFYGLAFQKCENSIRLDTQTYKMKIDYRQNFTETVRSQSPF